MICMCEDLWLLFKPVAVCGVLTRACAMDRCDAWVRVWEAVYKAIYHWLGGVSASLSDQLVCRNAEMQYSWQNKITPSKKLPNQILATNPTTLDGGKFDLMVTKFVQISYLGRWMEVDSFIQISFATKMSCICGLEKVLSSLSTLGMNSRKWCYYTPIIISDNTHLIEKQLPGKLLIITSQQRPRQKYLDKHKWKRHNCFVCAYCTTSLE